jgi:hypothetical protein
MTDERSAVPTSLLVGAIVVIAGFMRVWALDFGFPYPSARPDEQFPIQVVLEFLKGNFKPLFFDYPWAYMYALGALSFGWFLLGAVTGRFDAPADLIATWADSWQTFYLLSRGLSAAAGTLTVLVVWRLGTRLGGRTVGLLAAVFQALAFLHVRDSHYGTTDVAMTLLVALAILYLVDAHTKQDTRVLYVAALFAGLAAATKYTAVLAALPVGLCAVLTGAAGGQMRVRRTTAALAIAGGIFVAAFAAGVPFVISDHERWWAEMTKLVAALQAGHGDTAAAQNGWLYHFAVSLRHGLGVPLLLLGLAGSVLVLARHRMLGGLFLLYPAVHFLVAGLLGALFVRYMVPVVPFLCVTAAVAATTLTAPLARWRLQGTAALALGLAAVAPSAWNAWQFNRILEADDTRALAGTWIDEHVPAGSSLLQTGTLFGHPAVNRSRYTLWGREVFLPDGSLPPGRPDWIILQESPIPSTVAPIVRTFLADGYVLMQQYKGYSPEETRNLYDMQDAFFVPFAGFHRVTRPGPNLYIYRRVEAPQAGPTHGGRP